MSIGEGSIKLNGTDYPLAGRTFMGVSLDDISKNIGIQIDVLLGADILSKTDLFVWFWKEEIHYDPTGTPNVPMELVMGVPVVEILIQSRKIRACIDTGAQHSYVTNKIAEGLVRIGEVEDFYPGMGAFRAEQVQVELPGTLEQDSRTFEMNIAVLPSTLEALVAMIQCEAILGIDYLTSNHKTHVAFDYGKKLMSNY